MNVSDYLRAPVTELPPEVVYCFKQLPDKHKLRWEHMLLSQCSIEQAVIRRKQLGVLEGSDENSK